jgi:hypothetical protein
MCFASSSWTPRTVAFEKAPARRFDLVAGAALGEDRWVTMFNTPGRMAGIYRSGNHAQAKAYFAFRSAPLDDDHRDRPCTSGW